MRRAAWVLVLAAAPWASADEARVLTKFLTRLEPVARDAPRLGLSVLRDRLGLETDGACVGRAETASPATAACWRDVVLPGLGWRGAAGDTPGQFGMLTLRRTSGACVNTAAVMGALRAPMQRRSQMVGVGHAAADGLELPLPVFQSRPTWRYVAAGKARPSEIWLDEDAQGCVQAVTLQLGLTAP